MKARIKHHGFSLLELLVALAVMALALGMLYQADAGVVRGIADQKAEQRVTMLMQSLLDSRESVPAGGWNEQGDADGLAWRVASRPLPLASGLASGTALLHEVRLSVSWAGRNGVRELVWTTLLPQAVPKPGTPTP